MIDVNVRPATWPEPQDHQRGDDPIGDWLYQAQQVDLNGVLLEEGVMLCDPQVTIVFDQWAECYVCCDHGLFVGVARGVNLQEALDRATAKFVAFPHLVSCSIIHAYGMEVPYETADGCQLPAAHDGEHRVLTTAAQRESWLDGLQDQRRSRVEYCEHGLRSALHGYDVSDTGRTMLGVYVHVATGERCTPEREGHTWDARVPEVDIIPGGGDILDRVADLVKGM